MPLGTVLFGTVPNGTEMTQEYGPFVSFLLGFGCWKVGERDLYQFG